MKTSLEHGSTSDPNKLLLAKVIAELERKVNKDQFDTWFRGFGLIKADRAEVVFSVPNGFLRDFITRNYLEAIHQAVDHATGFRPSPRISFATGPDNSSASSAAPIDAEFPPLVDCSAPAEPQEATTNGAVAPAAGNPVPDVSSGTTEVKPPLNAGECQLNDRYTFEEFVVGSCNRFAHAAALAISTNPGRAYNPFFVHGNVGLGKTHLLQAICHAILRAHPSSRVLYLSCEEFTNRFIDGIQRRSLTEFRAYHRSVDVLVIDDVEFLANKSQTQEEFFHTFNKLYNGHKQIILSSDCTPPDIPSLEDRLVSRFKWGLETDITPPCFETRVAIARRKAHTRSVELPVDVLHFLAEHITANIRELEGAVIKVLGQATITGSPINLALAERALRDGSIVRNRQITLPDIMNLITGEFSISAKDLTSKSRTQAVSLPRQIGMFLSRSHTDHSLEEVGRFFGNRDHTTVLYAVGKIKKRWESDRMFHDLLSGLSQRLQSGNFDHVKRSR